MSETFPLLSDEQIISMRKSIGISSAPWGATLPLARAIESASRAPLLARIAELEREAETLRVDAKRLNWLESQRMAYGFQDIHEGNQWCVEGAYCSVREAIDAESNVAAIDAISKATGGAA